MRRTKSEQCMLKVVRFQLNVGNNMIALGALDPFQMMSMNSIFNADTYIDRRIVPIELHFNL